MTKYTQNTVLYDSMERAASKSFMTIFAWLLQNGFKVHSETDTQILPCTPPQKQLLLFVHLINLNCHNFFLRWYIWDFTHFSLDFFPQLYRAAGTLVIKKGIKDLLFVILPKAKQMYLDNVFSNRLCLSCLYLHIYHV